MSGSNQDTPPYDFSGKFSVRIGLFVIFETACISFLTSSWLLFSTASRIIRSYRQYGGVLPDKSYIQPTSVLFLYLLFANACQALGSALSLRWSIEGRVHPGAYCTTQGILTQMGDTGSALITSIIAMVMIIYTLSPPRSHTKRERNLSYAVGLAIIVFLALLISIPSAMIPNYYGSNDLWCWISGEKPVTRRLRIGAETAWIWFGLGICTTCCLCAVLNRAKTAKVEPMDSPLDSQRPNSATFTFPAAYAILVLPTVVVRAIDHFPIASHHPTAVRHGWAILAQWVLASSGATNVLLWLTFGRQFGLTPTSALSHNATFASKSRLQPTSTRYTDMTLDIGQRLQELIPQGPQLDGLDSNSAEWDPYNHPERIQPTAI
ncbi:uncharacterized protein EI90DRAFT_3291648 [Cantharellus anzutake]|uniref:uncharacterized protein n=1 Tax=Cantharellus anzutake TaxID=1750568 RepID=UPI00190760CA|nr:uncharacterized protein EI90DRAFT_3291648 [Cantharellus anzutake]KAF8325882.1 hypothetical protein EI90DRAFT_3291648 [Cantharellus anzutake]